MITLDFEQSILKSEAQLAEEFCSKIEKLVNEHESKDGIINIRFVSDAEIQRLNRMYRKKDEVTDVLSFQYPGDKDCIGDVAISYDQAKRQAPGNTEHEVIDLIIHGILHTLGYDHEKPGEDNVMFSLQDKIVESLL